MLAEEKVSELQQNNNNATPNSFRKSVSLSNLAALDDMVKVCSLTYVGADGLRSYKRKTKLSRPL